MGDIPDDEKTLGDRIRKRRKELRLTQEFICSVIGNIGSTQLGQIENNKSYPSYHVLTGLAAMLNCSLDWLCRGHEWGGDLYKTKSRLRIELDSYLNKLTDPDLEPLVILAKDYAYRRTAESIAKPGSISG